MIRLAHLSDLHFGDQPPGLARTLAAAIAHATPDLVIISGDLTQRARKRQFLEAKAWLDALARPALVVPGNHDLPLLAFWTRLLRPRGLFRSVVAQEQAPCWRAEGLLVRGVDSTRRWRWKSGRLPRKKPRPGKEPLQILVTHHPFAGESTAGIRLPGMPLADVVLTGHDHHSRVELLRTASAAAGTLQVVAGTALSRRLRGEPNSFFLMDAAVDVAAGHARLTLQRWEHLDGRFLPAAVQAFAKRLNEDAASWTPLTA